LSDVGETEFQSHWRALAERWELAVEAPFRVEVRDVSVDVPVLLRDFGGPRGMLLVPRFDLIKPYADELVEDGYGVSCLPEASGRRELPDDDTLVQMLGDWGWYGSGAPPRWYRDGRS